MVRAAESPVEVIDLSVVVPVHDDARRIAPTTLRSIAGWLALLPIASEIVVVDDSSPAGTRDLVDGLALANLRSITSRRGHGHAVRTGMLAARGRRRLYMQADNATPIDELPMLIIAVDPPHTRGADIAIGSRYLPSSRADAAHPIHRRALSRLATRVIRRALIPEIADPRWGFRLFTAEAAEAIFSRTTSEGWGIEVEMLAIARQLGLVVAECGVAWHDDRHQQLAPLRDAVRTSRELLALRRSLKR